MSAHKVPAELIDEMDAKKAKQRKKRGSRVWLAEKLNGIETSAGIAAREMATEKWASLVWDNPHEAAAAGADAIEQIHNLSSIFQKIKDPDAAWKIEEILFSGDDEQIKKVSEQLGDKRIKKAIQMQTLTEEQICRLAQPRCTHKNPTGHLKARQFLRKEAKQGTALLNMTLGLIGSDGHHHATPYELKMRNDQKVQWRKFGESISLIRGDETVSMLTVMQAASINKFNEILTLTKGIENYAKAAGLTWAFITLTAPARMHPNPANGKNTWDGTTPDQAHKWIADAAGRVVKRLLKKGITISGLRVVESHKDGCPHWHLLVFAPPDQMPIIEAEYKWQPEWKSIPGMEFMLNDGTAKASSYIFKYIKKTISSVEKIAGEAGFVDAWRSTWGIRAFAFFGMPPVSLWRNLRTTKECPDEPLIAELWRAAHRGDGHAFIELNGGLNVARSDRPVISKTVSDKNDKTKTIEFILQETAESIKFDFIKWQQEQTIERKPNKNAMVEVILNYPRRSKAKSKPIEFASGRAGNDSLHPDEWACSLIRGRIPPHHSPFSPPVGMARTQHGTDALVGALQPRLPPPWWVGVDMMKAPSLTHCHDNKTGKPIYHD